MGAGAGSKLLVVDDESKVAARIAEWLRKSGYDAESETNPVTAFERARQLRPRLMIIDWKMATSTYDGLELLFNLRRDPELSSTPVVLMLIGMAWYHPDEFFRSISFAPDDYIGKPFHPSELLEKVKRLLSDEQNPAD